MTTRTDYLSVCNDKSVPVNDFTMSFCNRCTQKECTRSQYGSSAFDKRVNTWEDRLFKDIPRMPKSDPRYLPLASVDFKTVEQTRTTVVFDTPKWFDPRDIPSSPSETEAPPPQVVVPETKIEAKLEVPETKIEAKLEATQDVEEEKVAKVASPYAKNLPKDLLLLNTKGNSFVLPGAPQQVTVDKWSGPVSAGEAPSLAPVVKKGATIKFGGSGGVE